MYDHNATEQKRDGTRTRVDPATVESRKYAARLAGVRVA